MAAFMTVHAIWIADIWFNVVPMVVSGAVCGASIVWSYQETGPKHSWRKWAAYCGGCALLLIGLGGVSFLIFEPRFTMAELMDAEDALGRLLPSAMPLIGAGTAVGTLTLWMVFGRKRTALLPILVSQALLMFLVGHNLAVLGLVDIPTDQLYRVSEFVGLTAFLAAAFGVSTMVITLVRSSRTVHTRARLTRDST